MQLRHDGALTLELVDFFISNYPEYIGKERKIERQIKSHIKYKTGDYGIDDKGIVYIIRYNITEGLNQAFILDFIIREDCRNNIDLIRYVTSRNWMRWPSVERFEFSRSVKYPHKGIKSYKLIKLFKNIGDKNGRNRYNTIKSTSSTNSSAISA